MESLGNFLRKPSKLQDSLGALELPRTEKLTPPLKLKTTQLGCNEVESQTWEREDPNRQKSQKEESPNQLTI